MLDKLKLIEHIRTMNRSARREWLECFDIKALRQYHDHLQQARGPRRASARWTRQGETAAAVTRRAMV